MRRSEATRDGMPARAIAQILAGWHSFFGHVVVSLLP